MGTLKLREQPSSGSTLEWPELVLWVSIAALGLVVIFVASIVMGQPTGGVGPLLASMVLVAFFATMVGRAAAFALAALAIGLGAMVDWSTTEIDLGRPTFIAFACTILAVALLVDALTRERQRTADGLERLQFALGELTDQPDLDTTLDSAVESARGAVRALAAVLILWDGGVIVSGPVRKDVLEETVERAPRDPPDRDNPIVAAVLSSEPIVVSLKQPQLRRFVGSWLPDLDELRARDLAVVPLTIDGSHAGVLMAVTDRARPDALDLRLLALFASQVSVVIARSQAYEGEREIAGRLAEADRLKSEFLGLVSHELRTPLTAAKGFVDTVLLQWDRIDDDTRRDLLRRASENADELTRLITQLLDFTRIEGELPPLHVQPQPLHSTVAGIVNAMGGALARHIIQIGIDSDLWITGDADAISYVVSNVLGNAAKFAPAGSTISIDAAPAGEEVVVSISDQGPGIPPEQLDLVFDRFYQLADRRGASRKGAGLGLAIARRYVDLQGGRIWVESRLGEGATFRFTLPEATNQPDAESRSPRPGLTGDDAAMRIDQPVSPD